MPRDTLGRRGNRSYSPGTHAGNLIFVSGQLGVDENGELVSGGAEAEIRQIFENIKSVLTVGGATLDDVTMVNVYLTDRASDFGTMDRIFAHQFGDSPPARATVEVSQLGLGAKAEIAVIAVL